MNFKNEKKFEENNEILLNLFTIHRKRYRVLLDLDKIVWERENRTSEKFEVSLCDIIAIKHSAKKTKLSEYLIPSSHSSTSNGSSSPTSSPESPQSQQSAAPIQRENHFSNLAFQVTERVTEQTLSSPDEQTTLATGAVEISTEFLNSQYLILYYAKRLRNSRKEYNKWRKKTVIFYSCHSSVISQWYCRLEKLLNEQKRPKSILMFVNPYGGRQQGLQIYDKQCKPLFQLAGIDVSCVISQRANQIRDIIMEQSLDQYDAVCCVGGDGTFSEVFNGLIYREMKDLNIDMMRPEYIPKPKLPIGIIPGGSTDTVVYCMHGTCDVITAAIHIILGQKRGLDLASVYNANGLIRLYASVLSYGYLGDIAFDSEKFRWMGPKRYDYSGMKKFFSNRGYHCDITFLSPDISGEILSTQLSSSEETENSAICPEKSTLEKSQSSSFGSTKSNSDDPADKSNFGNSSATIDTANNDDDVSKKCYVNCLRCTNSTISLNTEINNCNSAQNYSLHKYDSEDCVNNTTTNAMMRESAISDDFQFATNVNNFYENSVCDKSPKDDDNDGGGTNCSTTKGGEKKLWKKINGKFFIVSGANISCSCARSPNGLSQFGHLGDGYLDILLVRHTSFLNNCRLLMAMSNRNGDISNLPFVELYRTKKFLFRAKTPHLTNINPNNEVRNMNSSRQPITVSDMNFRSQWNCDGEVIHDSDVVISSHCQLIDVFMRGPYPSEENVGNSRCCGKFFG